ncbi:hypothetical protein MKEN_01474200 [Mycena kentingensis (nom. inval.)]|nr:hypothetical protein MKEN_01474200 [Mycena kentingensis (nom. inval.)]
MKFLLLLAAAVAAVSGNKAKPAALPATFDAYVSTNIDELMARLSPVYVPLAELQAIAAGHPAERDASFKLAERLVPPESFLHSVRCYYFALGTLYSGFPSGTPGIPQIPATELATRLYHGAILHDLGWTQSTEGLAHPAHTMSFELFGGIRAYEHLQAEAPSLNGTEVSDIVQSIMLHTLAPGWSLGMSSATGMLLSLSAWFDVGGYDVAGPGSRDRMISRDTVREIEAAYPRGSFAKEGTAIVESEFARKPDCLISHMPGIPENLPTTIRVDPIVE